MATARIRVPFANLQAATRMLRGELDAAIAEVLDSGWFVLGRQGEELESELAAACGVDHVVGVASGTDAIELALRALGVGPGDEVITQANTCVPTVAAIERAEATPVLCDVEPDAGTMDPDSLAATIGPSTKAIVPVHLYGQCADMDALHEVANGIPLVEDCAQAHGAVYKGRAAGTIGALGCFSFYPTKNLGALGDGGAVSTQDPDLAERLRLLRQYGQIDRYRHVTRGVNSRLDELQAAVLRVKLRHLDKWNARRNDIARSYEEALEGAPVRPLARLPERRHAYHLFVVRAPNRERFRARLEELGVATLIHYPEPIHGHEPYRGLGAGPVPLPHSELLAASVLSLPLYPDLTDEDVGVVATAVAEAARI